MYRKLNFYIPSLLYYFLMSISFCSEYSREIIDDILVVMAPTRVQASPAGDNILDGARTGKSGLPKTRKYKCG